MEQLIETGEWNISPQEKNIKTLIPKIHEKYPEINRSDIERIIDYCFVQLFRYIRNDEDISLKFALNKKIASFTFIKIGRDNVLWKIKDRARYNAGRPAFFKIMRIYRKNYGKTQRTEYF